MKFFFSNEPDTKENRIKDLNMRRRCKMISSQLYNEALELLYRDKKIRYYTSFDKVVKIEIVK